ncbi:thermonuclease family protein [Bradyrhizobium sp. SYSU BS000235]|uniref:thermonuclease family protein n=1 Tax=Bradyrhizobium sp. SYSU BS000235 TaxID=3411332 RepID=UPI003C72C689
MTLLTTFSDELRAACNSTAQGEGRVVSVISATTIRLDDGREVKLAGIEPAPENPIGAADLLTSLIAGRDVSLAGEDDQPDRYGRQRAFVSLSDPPRLVQAELLRQGAVMAYPPASDRDCSGELLTAENTARTGRRGIWASSAALKNAKRPGDILTGIGRFLVVEGKVLSARQAGATFYVNFGRRWTRDFAVTISRRMMPSFENAGLDLKSLVNKRIRVRGWVEKHGGPRMEMVRPSQIELIPERGGVVTNRVPAHEGE